MEAMYTTLLFIFLASISLLLIFKKKSKSSSHPLGSSGFPIIGETIDFATAAKTGHPEKFVFDRMTKYSSLVFKTHLFGAPAAVLCGADGNKFIFTNENKLVRKWHSTSIKKIFPHYMKTSANERGSKLRKMLPIAIKADALRRHVGIMDLISRSHFINHWDDKEEIVVYPLAKDLTLWVACRLFLSMDDVAKISRFAKSFDVLIAGLYSVPIDFPGTTLNRAINASNLIKEQLYSIIHERKIELAEGKANPDKDVLSHMLSLVDEDGKSEDEMNIADMILGLLIGGHDTATSACTSVVKYLAEYPEVYDAVYNEQVEIANSKEDEELLNWEDMQKMKYSWKVACEVMRLAPPASGGFREAKIDFNFKGFNIPKGWKLYWSIVSTHKNPDFFPNPDKFDPSRFDGTGPAPYTFIPFGAGPRMCPGNEYARLLILVFMHNIVKRFRWEKVIPDEKTVVNPLPIPVNGLPIKLYPHPR